MNLYRFLMATRACFFCLIGLLILQVWGLGLDIVQGEETLSTLKCQRVAGGVGWIRAIYLDSRSH